MKNKALKAIFDSKTRLYLLAVILGLAAGYGDWAMFHQGATVISKLFINLLKLVSLPIIFLSIVATVSGMDSLSEIKVLGKKVVKYTLLTTVIAATVALAIFLVIRPVHTQMEGLSEVVDVTAGGSYWDYLIQSVPSNVIQPFSKNNVIGVLFLAMALSLASISLPDEQRKPLHAFFSSLYAAIMKVTMTVVRFMPLAIWAFVTLFVTDLRSGLEVESLALYLVCVILANIVQATVVLPLLLKSKGISPMHLFRSMLPALSVAFFSKSSSAALPMAIQCAKENAKISPKVAQFSLPLCTTINMNACAAFILTTVLFVSMSHGWTYTPLELVMWIFIATIAAIGNAGVPMGCYFMSTAFLVAMNVPLHILGVILPFYSLIDMLESAINVWSDSCVAATVQKELEAPATLETVPVTE